MQGARARQEPGKNGTEGLPEKFTLELTLEERGLKQGMMDMFFRKGILFAEN